MGFYIGIGGVLTFKNCKLADTLSQLNKQRVLEQIVLETDAPYMAPVPMRGQRNESAYAIHVVRKLAESYGVSEQEVAERTNSNVQRVFGIKI
jgi:TatD DNase family protein